MTGPTHHAGIPRRAFLLGSSALAAGKHTLMARATDKRGRTQPMERDPDLRNYMITHVVPVAVEVRS
jgi:hypothetical protein